MSDTDELIRLLRQRLGPWFFYATVEERKDDERLCIVKPIASENATLKGFFRATNEAAKGVLFYPTVDSTVLCAAVDYDARQAHIIQYGELDKVVAEVEEIKLGTGSYEDAVLGNEIKSQLDTILSKVEALGNEIANATVTDPQSGSQVPLTNKATIQLKAAEVGNLSSKLSNFLSSENSLS
jgi:hypothetical protein